VSARGQERERTRARDRLKIQEMGERKRKGERKRGRKREREKERENEREREIDRKYKKWGRETTCKRVEPDTAEFVAMSTHICQLCTVQKNSA